MHFTSKLPDVGTTIFTVMSRRALRRRCAQHRPGISGLSDRSAIGEASWWTWSAEGRNQYAPMEGVVELREQIRAKLEGSYGAASTRNPKSR